jgi:hypothetical protein
MIGGEVRNSSESYGSRAEAAASGEIEILPNFSGRSTASSINSCRRRELCSDSSCAFDLDHCFFVELSCSKDRDCSQEKQDRGSDYNLLGKDGVESSS